MMRDERCGNRSEDPAAPQLGPPQVGAAPADALQLKMDHWLELVLDTPNEDAESCRRAGFTASTR